MITGRTESIAPAPLPPPMGIAALINTSIRILRSHWAPLLGVVLVVVGPATLLTTAMLLYQDAAYQKAYRLYNDGLFMAAVAEFERLEVVSVLIVLASILELVLIWIATLGFAAIVSAEYHARPIALSDALRTCLRRALSAITVLLIAPLAVLGLIVLGLVLSFFPLALLGGAVQGAAGALIVLVGSLLAMVVAAILVPAVIYLVVRMTLVLPVLAIEDEGWRQGLNRSWHLSGRNVWRTFIVVVLTLLAEIVLGLLVFRLVAIVPARIVAEVLGLDVLGAETITDAVVTLLLLPLAPVVITVLYFDLRARRDVADKTAQGGEGALHDEPPQAGAQTGSSSRN